MASYYYNKKSKLWSVRFLCFENGKRVYKRLSGFAKRSDAIDHYTLVINQYKNPSKEQSINIKFNDAVEKYLTETALHTKESTVVDKRSVFKFHILPYFANKKLNEITKNLLNDWQTEIWTKKRENGQKYSHKYLKNIRTIFNHFLNWCFDCYNMPNYLKLIKIPKNQTIKKEMHIWELDEFQTFLKIFETNPNILYQTFFMFQYYTGNRLMETLALSEDDLKNNCVNVNKSIINKTLDNTLYKIVPTKNYTVRQVPLPSVLLEQIKIYLKWKRDNNIVSQYLFGGNTIMSGSTIRRVFAKYTKIAGLNPIRIHDLRHSYVSALIHLGITTKVIASLIGDREEQVIKTYSHLYLDDKDNAIAVLNTALNKLMT